MLTIIKNMITKISAVLYCKLELICKVLQKFEIAKGFNGYVVVEVVMNFRKHFSIAKFYSQVSLALPQIFSDAKNSSLQHTISYALN